jgi:hypothetical protein
MKTFKHVFRYLVYWSRSHLGVFNVSSDRRRFFKICPGWTMRGLPRARTCAMRVTDVTGVVDEGPSDMRKMLQFRKK